MGLLDKFMYNYILKVAYTKLEAVSLKKILLKNGKKLFQIGLKLFLNYQ